MNDYIRILEEMGFTLDDRQPHLSGERRIFAAHKLVLFGKRTLDSLRVVIKASNTREGSEEITNERRCRKALDEIRFAYGTFYSPEEVLFEQKSGYTIQVTRFIEQDMSYLDRPIKEQFHFALKGLKAMETAHAATYEHLRSVRNIFPSMHSDDYIRGLSGRSQVELSAHRDDVERYCGFLTHFDFMPQNFRIADGKIYLLDHSSLRFGSKHESWARLINFMVLYNRELADALEKYVLDNRSPEESASLRLMRIYRLEELIAHHAKVAELGDEDLHELSRSRVAFWEKVLEYVIEKEPVPAELVETYKTTRDRLRSAEETERQKGLH